MQVQNIQREREESEGKKRVRNQWKIFTGSRDNKEKIIMIIIMK